MKSLIKLFANVNILIGIILMIIPVGYIFAINTPQVWYRINPNAVEDEVTALTKDPFAENFGSIDLISQVFAEAPAKDASLSTTNSLKINRIGVDTTVIEDTDEHRALNKGVWRLPQYGTPLDNDKPIMLAAHRWGPTGITTDYRNKNMFINVPDLRPGDEIEIVWDQRKYTYRVTDVKTEETVTQLSDLILITCKFYNHPDRIMVYAERVL